MVMKMDKTFELIQFKKGQKIHALDDRVNKTYCISLRNKDLTNIYYTNFGDLKDITCQSCKDVITDREIQDELDRWHLELGKLEEKARKSIMDLKDGERLCDMCLEPSKNYKVINFPLKDDIKLCFLCSNAIGKQLL